MDQVIGIDSENGNNDNNIDPYDLSITLDDNEDDFNIEDITEDQVKELLADEENRFLLEDEDERSESGHSQINTIGIRVNDKNSGNKSKSTDAKSYRNTSNLITIDCDEEDEEDEEGELDERRHSKFKSERVIHLVDKKPGQEDRNIPESLDAVIVAESQDANRAQQKNKNSHTGNNKRIKGRSFNPSSRPFIGNNSLASMGLLPGSQAAYNKIHVNPHFKTPNAPLATRMASPLGLGNLRSMSNVTSHPGRIGSGQRPMRPMINHGRNNSHSTSCFADLSPSGQFPANPIVPPPIVEQLIANQSLSEQEECQLLDGDVNHHNPSHHPYMNNRQPLLSQPMHQDNTNWQASRNLSGQQLPRWLSNTSPLYPNLPPHLQPDPRFLSQFNSNMRPSLFGNLNHGNLTMNKPLFGVPPRHPMQARFNGLPMFNQSKPSNSPFTNPPNEFSRHPRPPRPEIHDMSHPLPPLQRHQIPLHFVHNRPQFAAPNQPRINRPNHNSIQVRTSTPSTSNNNPSNSHPSNLAKKSLVASSSLSSSPQAGPSGLNRHQPHSQSQHYPSSSSSVIDLDDASPHYNNGSSKNIDKVIPFQNSRPTRPSTSNVNLNNIRTIKTISSNGVGNHDRKISLTKRLTPKETANRVVTLVKQVEIVDLDDVKKVQQKQEEPKKPNPIIVDLDIDEEYKRKLEEQKKLREEIIRKKEEKRRQMIAEKLKNSQTAGGGPSSKIATSSTSSAGPVLSTIIERVSPVKDISGVGEKRAAAPSNENQVSPIKRKATFPSPPHSTAVPDKTPETSSERKTVEIRGLALTTNKATILKLCSSVGPIESCILNVTNTEKRAIVTFQSSRDASTFESRFQRHLVDLCVIEVSLLW